MERAHYEAHDTFYWFWFGSKLTRLIFLNVKEDDNKGVYYKEIFTTNTWN